MKFTGFLIILVLLSTVLWGCTTTETPLEGLSMEERLEDFDYLFNLIMNNYSLLRVNERQNGINWAKEKTAFEAKIKNTTTNQEFQREISNVLKKLNDEQTHVVDNSQEISNNRSAQKINTIIPLNTPSFTASILVPDEVAYLKIEHMMITEEELEGIAEELRMFFAEISAYTKLIIDIRGNQGGLDLYWKLGVVSPLIDNTISVDNYFFVRGPMAKEVYQLKGFSLYPTSQLDYDSIRKISREIRRDFNYYGITNVTIEPLEPVGFNGKIFLIVDNNISSSAEGFAAFARDSEFATLIGDTTKGNHRGGLQLHSSLPNSGIVVTFRGSLPINGDGTINAEVGTTPNIRMPNHSNAVGQWDLAIQFSIDLNCSCHTIRLPR